MKKSHTVVHAIALGSYGGVAEWHCHQVVDGVLLKGYGSEWTLRTDNQGLDLIGRVDAEKYRWSSEYGKAF